MTAIQLTKSAVGLLIVTAAIACSTTPKSTKAKSGVSVELEPAEASAPVTPAAASADDPGKKASMAESAGDGVLVARMAVPTGDDKTSALLLEKWAPAEVNVGQVFDYRIVVENLTDLALDDVVVNDKLPEGFVVKATTPAFMSSSVNKGVWELGTIGPRERQTISISGSATKIGTLASCADVTYSSSICMSTTVVAPALQMAITAPSLVTICDDIPVKYTVTNSGTGTAANVVLNATYPKGLRDANGRTSLSQKLGTLGPGQAKDHAVMLKADASGKYSNAGDAAADGDLTAKSMAIETQVVQPVLAIEMTGSKKTFIGRKSKYQVKVSNTGDSVAPATVLETQIPSNTEFVSATGGGKLVENKIVWQLGNVESKAEVNLGFELRAKSGGIARPAAAVSATCAPKATAVVETQLNGIPALLLEVVDQVDPVIVGDQTTYRVTVTNQGSAPGTDIKIVATLPDNTSYVSSKGHTRGVLAGLTVRFDGLKSLAPQDVAVWEIVVRGDSAKDSRFKVSMASNELGDRPVEETEATTFYE